MLHWTADQCEDYYTVLINGRFLITVEINRFDDTYIPIIERTELKEYLHGLSRMYQVQLLVTQELVCKK